MSRSVLSFLFILVLSSFSAAQDLNEAKGVIENATNSVIALLKDASLEKNARRDRIMEIINPLFDFELMSKLTLGKEHWPKLSDLQKKEFTDLFVDILKTVYLEKAETFSDQTLEYDAPSLVNNKVHVVVYIIQGGERYKMVYKMYNKTGWLVYDLEIQDISIIKSYQSQFTSFLQTGTVEELLAKMKGKFDGSL